MTQDPSAPPPDHQGASSHHPAPTTPLSGGALESVLAQILDRLAELEAGAGHLPVRSGARAVDEGDAGELAGDLWLIDRVSSQIGGNGGVVYGGEVRLPDGRQAAWQMGHRVEEILEDDWRDYELSLKALGHRNRLALLHDLLVRPQTALQLAASELHGTTGQIYNHLHQLVEAGWLTKEQRGLYGVPVGRVVSLLAVLSAARREH